MMSDNRSPSGTCAHPLHPVNPMQSEGGLSTPRFHCGGGPRSSSSADMSPGVSPEKSPPLPSHNPTAPTTTGGPLPHPVYFGLWSCSLCSHPPYLEFPSSFIKFEDVQPPHNFFHCRTGRRNAVQLCFEFPGMCHTPMPHLNWFLGATLGDVYDFIESVGSKFLAYIMSDYDPQHSAIFNRVNVRLRVFTREGGARQAPAYIEYPENDPVTQAQYNAFPCRKVNITPGRAVVVSLIDSNGALANVWEEYLAAHPEGFPSQHPQPLEAPAPKPSPPIPSSSSSNSTATPITDVTHNIRPRQQQQQRPVWVDNHTPTEYNRSPPPPTTEHDSDPNNYYQDPTPQPAYYRGPFIRINGELIQMPNQGGQHQHHHPQHRHNEQQHHHRGGGYESGHYPSNPHRSRGGYEEGQASSSYPRHHQGEAPASVASPTPYNDENSHQPKVTISTPLPKKETLNAPVRNSSGYSGTEWFDPGNMPLLASLEDQKIERHLQALKAEHAFLANKIEAAKAKMKSATTVSMGTTLHPQDNSDDNDDDDDDDDDDEEHIDNPPPVAPQGVAPQKKDSSHITTTATPTPSKHSPPTQQHQPNKESRSPPQQAVAMHTPRPARVTATVTHFAVLDTDPLKSAYTKAKWLAYALPTVGLRANGRDLLLPEQAVLNLLLSLGVPDRGHTSQDTRLRALGRRILQSQSVTREVAKGFHAWAVGVRGLLMKLAEQTTSGNVPDSTAGMARQLQQESMTCLGILNNAIVNSNFCVKDERSRCSISLSQIPLRVPAFLLRLLLDRFGTVVNVRFRMSNAETCRNMTTLAPVTLLPNGAPTVAYQLPPHTKVRDGTSHPWCSLYSDGGKLFTMAFVEYATPSEAANALNALNGLELGTHILKADLVQNQSYTNGIQSAQESQYWLQARCEVESYTTTVLGPLLRECESKKVIPRPPIVLGSGTGFKFNGYAAVVPISEIVESEELHAVVVEHVSLPDPAAYARDMCAALKKLTSDSQAMFKPSPKSNTKGVPPPVAPPGGQVVTSLLNIIVECETRMLTSSMLTASVAVTAGGDGAPPLDTNSLLTLVKKTPNAVSTVSLRPSRAPSAKIMAATVASMDNFLIKQQEKNDINMSPNKKKGKTSKATLAIRRNAGVTVLSDALEGARSTADIASSLCTFAGITGDMLFIPQINHSPSDFVDFAIFVSSFGRTPADITEFLSTMVALRSCTLAPERRVADLLKSATSKYSVAGGKSPPVNAVNVLPQTMRMTFNELAAKVGADSGVTTYLDATHTLATHPSTEKDDRFSVYKYACGSMRSAIVPDSLFPWGNTDSPASTPDLRRMIDLFSTPYATTLSESSPRRKDCIALIDMFALALSRSNTDALSTEMHGPTFEPKAPFAVGLCSSSASSVTPFVTTNRHSSMRDASSCQRLLFTWRSLSAQTHPNLDEVLRDCYKRLSGTLFLHGAGAWLSLNMMRYTGNIAAKQVKAIVSVRGFRLDCEEGESNPIFSHVPFASNVSALSSPVTPYVRGEDVAVQSLPGIVPEQSVTPPSTPRRRSVLNHSAVEPSPVPSPQATGPGSEKKRAAMHPTPQYQRDSADCSVLSSVSIAGPIPPPTTPQVLAPTTSLPKHYSMSLPAGQRSDHNTSASTTNTMRVSLLRDHSNHVSQCKAHTDLRNVAMVRVLESTTMLMHHTIQTPPQPVHHRSPCMDSHFHATAMQWLPESSALSPIPHPSGDAARVMGFIPLTEKEVIHASNAIDLTATSIHTALVKADKAFAKLFPDTMLSVSQSTLNMSSTPSNNVSLCNTSLMVDSLQTSRLTARVSPPGSQPPLNSKAKKQRCINTGDATSAHHLTTNISAVLDLLLDGSTDSDSDDNNDSTLLDVGQPMPPTNFKDSLRTAITVCARLLKTSDPRQLSTLGAPFGSNDPLGTITPKPVSIHLGLVGVYMGLLLHTMSTKGDICAASVNTTNTTGSSRHPVPSSSSSLGVAQLLNKCIVDLKRLTADYFHCVQEWLVPSLNRAYFTNAVAFQTSAMNCQPSQHQNPTVLLATHNQYLLQYMLELMLSEPRESLAQLMFVGCLIEIELPHLALDLFEFIWETESRFNAACVDPPKELNPPFHIKEWMRLTSTGGEHQGWNSSGNARLAPAAPALLPPVIKRQPGGATRADRDQALRLIREASKFISYGRDSARVVMIDAGDANGLTPCEVGIMGAILLPCTPCTTPTPSSSSSAAAATSTSPKVETLASLLLQGRAPVVCQSDFFDPTPEVLHATLQRIARAINTPSH